MQKTIVTEMSWVVNLLEIEHLRKLGHKSQVHRTIRKDKVILSSKKAYVHNKHRLLVSPRGVEPLLQDRKS